MGKFTLVDERYGLVTQLGVDAILLEFGTDVVLTQLADGNGQLVAHVSPQGIEHLGIEPAAVAASGKATGCLEAALCHLAGALGAHATNVGTLLELLAVVQQQGHKSQQRQEEPQPVRPAVDDVAMRLLEVQVTALDGTDVHVLHAVVVAGLAFALGHREMASRDGDGLILARIRVKIGEFPGGDVKLAGILRDEGIVYHDLAAHVAGALIHLDVGLGIIDVKLLGELHLGGLDVLDIARAADDVTVGRGTVGLESRSGLEGRP